MVAAAGLAAVLSMVACGGGEQGATTGPERMSFESFAAYLESADTRNGHGFSTVEIAETRAIRVQQFTRTVTIPLNGCVAVGKGIQQ